jgi:hypothetical protein
VEPARALGDLVEISPQIEAAAIFAGDGEVLGSVGVADHQAAALARGGRALLEGAAELRSGGTRVTQLHATLKEGDVLVVGGTRERSIVAVTSGRSAQGLLFYDLKRCLAMLEEQAGDAA